MMKALKITLATLVIVPVAAFMVATKAEPAKAQGAYSNNLGSLLVTNGLFSGYNAAGLSGLIAVNNLYGAPMSGGSAGAGGAGAYGTTDLNDALILNGLFTGYNAAGLSGLIAVNNIY